MSGSIQRIWPTVQVLGRTLVCNRSEILQGVRTYTYQTNSSNTNLGVNNGYFHHNLHFPDSSTGIVNRSVARTNRGTYMKIVSRTFSYGSYLYCREFGDEENDHAHNILKSLPAYSSTTVGLDSLDIHVGLSNLTPYQILIEKDWMICSDTEIIQAFIKISKLSDLYSLNFNDKMFDYFCDSLAQRIDSFDDKQIVDILKCLVKWIPLSNQNYKNFDNLCNALDETCLRRFKGWPTDQVFLIADHWYSLGLSRNLLCFKKFIISLSVRVDSFSAHQLVQFMFYANANRDLGFTEMNKLQKKILQSLHLLSIEELGIVTMSLFKTQRCIQLEALIEGIVKKTVENVNTISDQSLGSNLKLLRNSFKATSSLHCYDLLDKLYPHIDRFNNLSLLQVALLGNNLLVYHSKILDTIGGKFAKDLENIRLKDIERFSYVLMLYNFVPTACPQIFNLIIEELREPRRIVEINHFPKSFISCVSYLVTAGHFPHDLISAVFQPSMLQLLQNEEFSTLGRELSELDWALKIEAASYYVGFKLNSQLADNLTKKYCGRIPCKEIKSLTHHENLILDVDQKLSVLLGNSDFHQLACVLPHFKMPDIIFCTTNEGEPAAIPKLYRELSHLALKRPCGTHMGLKWNAIIVGGRNSFIRETAELRGNYEMKKRQLEKLGYCVTVVPHKGYVKSSRKYKFLFLEKILAHSTLNLEGRISKVFSELNLGQKKIQGQREDDEEKQVLSI